MTAIASAQWVERHPGVLKRKMTERMNRFLVAEETARKTAAATATTTTQSSFTYRRPVRVPKRKGRKTSEGKFTSYLTWKSTEDGRVAFDVKKADSKVWYWVIQEIGTGKRATLKEGGKANPRGRPAKGATYVRTIKAQTGRRIAPSLVWATGPRGAYIPPGAGNDQLFLRRHIKDDPRMHPARGMTISHEIKGQRMVHKGGDAGFREYKKSVLAAARLAFAGQKLRP